MVEQRQQPLSLVACDAKLGQQGGELRPHLVRRIVSRDPGRAAHHCADSAVGLFAQRRAGSLPNGHVAKALLTADAGDELVYQARFPDTGFADEAEKLRRAAAGLIKARKHALKLHVATDQRGAEAEHLKAARGSRRGERANQPMHQDAAGLATKRNIAKRLVGERMPGQTIGQRPDQHLARGGQRLQPLRRVHRVAGDGIGFRSADAQSSGNDRPGVDADMKHHPRARGGGALAEPPSPDKHVERGAERAFRVILVDETAKALDGLGQFAEQLGLQCLNDLGVELFAESGEAAQIGEEDRRRPAVGIGGHRRGRVSPVAIREPRRQPGLQRGGSARCRRGQIIDFRSRAGSASRAKREIRRTRIAAAEAWHRLARTAVRAERKAAFNLEAAARAVHRPRPRGAVRLGLASRLAERPR